MPNVRRSKKPCHCEAHNGELIHYKAFQRCARRREADAVNRAYNQPLIARRAIDPQSLDQMRVSPSDTYEFNDEMDTLLFQLYANHVNDRSSEESVAHNLIAISNAMRPYLPPDLHAKIPRTYNKAPEITEYFCTLRYRIFGRAFRIFGTSSKTKKNILPNRHKYIHRF